MTLYYFDPNVAKEFGIAAAVLFQNIVFWVKKNKANKQKTHYHNGRYWTHNSIDAFIELFPFLKRYTIKKSLKLLEEEGMILIDEFNEEAFDHTQWYTLGDLGQKVADEQSKPTIVRNQPNDCAKSTNRMVENEQPIPYKEHTDNKQENMSNNINIIPHIKECEKKFEKVANNSSNGDKKQDFKATFIEQATKMKTDDSLQMALAYLKIKDFDALANEFYRHIINSLMQADFIKNGYMRNCRWLKRAIPFLDLSKATGIKLGPGEMIDDDGNRYYINQWSKTKIIVPDDAPPRPSERHVWGKSEKCWITT